jgi:hypothetical protein
VRIGLVADVPDQPVARRVEHVVQRHGELDHAQPGAEMAAGDRNGRDRLLAQLVGELAQLVGLQPTDVGRDVDGIEKQWRWPVMTFTSTPHGARYARPRDVRIFPSCLSKIRGLSERFE